MRVSFVLPIIFLSSGISDAYIPGDDGNVAKRNAYCFTDGVLVCNGETQFGICDRGSLFWQNVSLGTICQDGRIVEARFSFRPFPITATTPASSTMISSTSLECISTSPNPTCPHTIETSSSLTNEGPAVSCTEMAGTTFCSGRLPSSMTVTMSTSYTETSLTETSYTSASTLSDWPLPPSLTEVPVEPPFPTATPSSWAPSIPSFPTSPPNPIPSNTTVLLPSDTTDPLPSNTTGPATSDTTDPSHVTLTAQPPPPTGTCDPHCNCATGGKSVPTEGRYLCGWCGAITAVPRYFVNTTDVVLCKDNGCCNFGFYDGRCENSLLEVPANFNLWCPWPVNEVDVPNSTDVGLSTFWSSLSFVTVPVTFSLTLNLTSSSASSWLSTPSDIPPVPTDPGTWSFSSFFTVPITFSLTPNLTSSSDSSWPSTLSVTPPAPTDPKTLTDLPTSTSSRDVSWWTTETKISLITVIPPKCTSNCWNPTNPFLPPDSTPETQSSPR